MCVEYPENEVCSLAKIFNDKNKTFFCFSKVTFS